MRMLDGEWGVLGAAVTADGVSPLVLSVADFAARLYASVKGTSSDIEALNELGSRLFHAGAIAHAAACYEIAAKDPRALGARVNLGRCEIRLGRAELAESRARRLISQYPRHVIGWQLLSDAMFAQCRFVEAKEAGEYALNLSGGDAGLAREWGRLAAWAKDAASAAKGFRMAWEQRPGDFGDLAQLVFYSRCLCEWSNLDVLSKQLVRALEEEQALLPPFDLLAEPTTAAQQAVCARRQAAKIKRMAEHQPMDRVSFASYPSNRLKVGFVSHGFGHHPTSILTSALFEQWRDSRLEVHLFSTRNDGKPSSRRRLAAAVHAFHELPNISQRDVATRVQAECIEVLVDLDGYTRVRLPEVFAYRPAPVQVSWLGYPGTTGADYMDYVIADRFVLPPSLQPHFTEKTVYLPRCYQSSDPTRVVGQPPSRTSFGLPSIGVIYACFNASFKLNPRSVKRMLQVLAAVPGSVLWLLEPGDGGEERLRGEALRVGVDPSRLVFMKKLPHLAYLACYRHVDLFLDTEDYNAHTVASDALWAGCPVLTRPGETFASRVAGSLNHHLGMPDMNVQDDATFVMKAVRYGRDLNYRKAMKAKLERQRLASELFNIQGFAKDFEDLLFRMVTHHRAGYSPGTFNNP